MLFSPWACTHSLPYSPHLPYAGSFPPAFLRRAPFLLARSAFHPCCTLCFCISCAPLNAQRSSVCARARCIYLRCRRAHAGARRHFRFELNLLLRDIPAHELPPLLRLPEHPSHRFAPAYAVCARAAPRQAWRRCDAPSRR